MELQTPHRHPTLPPLASTPGYPLSPTVPSTQLSASRAPSAPSVHAAAAAAHVPDPDAIGAAAENSAPVSEGNQRNGGGVLPSGALVLTSAELEVLRWGRNAAVNSGSRDMSAREYKKATAVEVLVRQVWREHLNVGTSGRLLRSTVMVRASVGTELGRKGGTALGREGAGHGERSNMGGGTLVIDCWGRFSCTWHSWPRRSPICT